jgi:hypothetical protein
MTRKFYLTILIVLAVFSLSGGNAGAQSEQPEYFPETGHYVTSAFYDFYINNPNARLVYGLPITEADIDPASGRLVQYFEKVRFEFFSENMPGDKVRLTPLGQKLYERGEIIPGLTKTTPNCYQSGDWDYPVCFNFHTFYQQYGGQGQFGRPISGLEHVRGRLVQYFEYTQMVWMPENPKDATIVLAPLGLKYFYAFETDYTKLEPKRNFIYNNHINKIQLSVFPRQALIVNGEAQQFDVIATDQNHAPLAKGILHIQALYPDGTIVELHQIPTDSRGLASFTLHHGSGTLGVVEVFVRLTFNDLETVAVTSFRIWY